MWLLQLLPERECFWLVRARSTPRISQRWLASRRCHRWARPRNSAGHSSSYIRIGSSAPSVSTLMAHTLFVNTQSLISTNQLFQFEFHCLLACEPPVHAREPRPPAREPSRCRVCTGFYRFVLVCNGLSYRYNPPHPHANPRSL